MCVCARCVRCRFLLRVKREKPAFPREGSLSEASQGKRVRVRIEDFSLQITPRGVVKFEDLLGTLKDYKRDGYQPKPGTVIETIDASMEWNLAIVSNTYAAPDEEAVAFAGLLDNVAIHEIANDEKTADTTDYTKSQ